MESKFLLLKLRWTYGTNQDQSKDVILSEPNATPQKPSKGYLQSKEPIFNESSSAEYEPRGKLKHDMSSLDKGNISHSTASSFEAGSELQARGGNISRLASGFVEKKAIGGKNSTTESKQNSFKK